METSPSKRGLRQQRGQRQLRLGAPTRRRQKCAPWPSQVAPRRAVRLGELIRIPIRGADHEQRALALGDHDTADGNVLQSDPRRRLHHAVEAQELLDRRAHQAGVGRQPAALVRMTQQREHGVADQVGGRLVPRDQDQHAHREQLVRAQPIALDLGAHQRADQVLARPRAPLGDDAVEEDAHLRQTALRGGGRLGCEDRGRLGEGDQGLRPAQEVGSVATGDAEHFRDHGHRQGEGEVAHQVEVASLERAVQQRVRDLLDARQELLHHPRREGLVHQVAQPRVIGRIAHQHHAQARSNLSPKSRIGESGLWKSFERVRSTEKRGSRSTAATSA
jgi:hypothetical protein